MKLSENSKFRFVLSPSDTNINISYKVFVRRLWGSDSDTLTEQPRRIKCRFYNFVTFSHAHWVK
jgi:hypothetical protein